MICLCPYWDFCWSFFFASPKWIKVHLWRTCGHFFLLSIQCDFIELIHAKVKHTETLLTEGLLILWIPKGAVFLTQDYHLWRSMTSLLGSSPNHFDWEKKMPSAQRHFIIYPENDSLPVSRRSSSGSPLTSKQKRPRSKMKKRIEKVLWLVLWRDCSYSPRP